MHIKEKKTSNDVLDKVAKVSIKAGVEIPNEVVDRVHRIGQSHTDKNTNTQCKKVIMHFTTFHHRTVVY